MKRTRIVALLLLLALTVGVIPQASGVAATKKPKITISFGPNFDVDFESDTDANGHQYIKTPSVISGHVAVKAQKGFSLKTAQVEAFLQIGKTTYKTTDITVQDETKVNAIWELENNTDNKFYNKAITLWLTVNGVKTNKLKYSGFCSPMKYGVGSIKVKSKKTTDGDYTCKFTWTKHKYAKAYLVLNNNEVELQTTKTSYTITQKAEFTDCFIVIPLTKKYTNKELKKLKEQKEHVVLSSTVYYAGTGVFYTNGSIEDNEFCWAI